MEYSPDMDTNSWTLCSDRLAMQLADKDIVTVSSSFYRGVFYKFKYVRDESDGIMRYTHIRKGQPDLYFRKVKHMLIDLDLWHHKNGIEVCAVDPMTRCTLGPSVVMPEKVTISTAVKMLHGEFHRRGIISRPSKLMFSEPGKHCKGGKRISNIWHVQRRAVKKLEVFKKPSCKIN